MKNRGVILVLILFFMLEMPAQPADDTTYRHQLMPVPAAVKFAPGRLKIDRSFSISVAGQSDPRLFAGIQRAARRLEGRTTLEVSRALAGDPQTATLQIRCNAPGKTTPSVDEDESYSLDVSERRALLIAPTAVGVLRGLETFLQLLDADRDGWFIRVCKINDKPRFRWRGLLIDVSRHFEPAEVIKRNLDAMAAVKLNVLHWHLTDDQGFRVECKRYPKLHEQGSDGLYYTQDQIRDVIAYARERGIRVVPEFDMPGHATSWLVGHPELGSAPGPYQIERKNGIFEPVFDPTREELYTFLDAFFSEMAGLFVDDYIHIGGDENEGHQWTRNPQIQDFMKSKGISDNHALQAYFNQRLSMIIQKLGKKMIGWDEILDPELPKETVIQSWRGPASLAEAAHKGYDGILSSGYYIDLNKPAWDHYKVDPVAGKLSEKELSHVLGGEATMWGEWVSPETIDSRIWPRTAAIAERLWSPRETTDVADMYRRLDVISVQLEELGLTHEKNVDVLLRRLARTKEIAPLKILVSVVEPVKEYHRGEAHPSTMLMPLTRLIDAVRPDSAAARRLDALVDDMLADAPGLKRNQDRIRSILSEWRDVRPSIDVLIQTSPALSEAAELPGGLEDLGTSGLEALSYVAAGVTPPAGWREAKLAMIERARKPKAEVEFAVIGSVKKLIILAAELSELRSMPASQWKERVTTLAAEKIKRPNSSE